MPLNPSNPDEKPRTKISGGLAAYIQAERLMQIALLLPASVFIGWLGGVWLDHLLGQRWIAVAGIVFGGVSGLVYVARMAMAASNDSASSAQSENHSGKNPKNDPEDGDQGGER
jgi:F0F1-type ATP synthase assembly protein I